MSLSDKIENYGGSRIGKNTGILDLDLEQIQDMLWRIKKKTTKTDTCHIWHGTATGRPNYLYGVIRVSGKLKLVTRVLAELYYGPLLPGMCVLHTCDNTMCVNPKHLWIGTHLDNMKDKKNKGRNVIIRFYGEGHANSVLSNNDVHNIRELHSLGKSYKEIAEIYNISKGHCYNIIRKIIWKHI